MLSIECNNLRMGLMPETFESKFKVASVSSNMNSFGLRGVILIDRSGLAFEVGMNHLNDVKTGQEISVVLNKHLNIVRIPAHSFEIPRKLPKPSDSVLKILFN